MKFRVLHFFGGVGGKALGFKRAVAHHAGVDATFETIGSIDLDPLACEDFRTLLGAPALCADVHEMEPADLLAFAGPESPDVVAMSPPCKGLSGLLSEKKAAEAKYQKMNTLMLRALLLVTSVYTPPLIFIENVPRMSSRGADVVEKSLAILHAAGYVVDIGTHDCGEIGGLAQHRIRWFLVARHVGIVPQVIYKPRKQRVRACGEVLGPLPMPGDIAAAGPMHAVPDLHWCNWLRLAEIPAGGDWRDIPGELADGEKRRERFRRHPVTPWGATADTVTGPGGSSSTNVADPRIALGCSPRAGAYGVLGFDDPSDAITGSMSIDNGRAAVADPRIQLGENANRHRHKYNVLDWDQTAFTVTSTSTVGGGAPSVADPRISLPFSPSRHWNKYAVHAWDHPMPTVIGAVQVGSGAPSVADPRWGGGRFGVSSWDEPTGAIAGESLPNNGKYSVADPRFAEGKKKNWQQVSGVTPWTKPGPLVTSGADLHAGSFSVADPRVDQLLPRYVVMTLEEARAADFDPKKPVPFIPVIIAADGTWHRPLTTLELAVLQSLPTHVNGKPLVLAVKAGSRGGHTSWRERIGNLVPPDAAQSVGDQLLMALLVSALGSFTMSNNDIWVAPSKEALVA